MAGNLCRSRPLRCLAGVVGLIAFWAFFISLAGPAYAVDCSSSNVGHVVFNKLTNDVDADAAPGPTLNVGDPVTWRYVAENIGTCTVTNLVITDNVEGSVCTILSLAPGETKECSLSGTVQAGQYANIGDAFSSSSRVKVQDPSHYFGGGTPVCGDGKVDPGEECDDGNDINTDGCRNDCTLPFCGDGIKDPGEQCDDGNQIDNDGCRNDCTTPVCGDGKVDPGEECDDGNTNNNDECRNDCTVPVCGDGIKDAGEECDDGNDINDDACRNDCTLPFCGDGILDKGEECDDGNNKDGDGCSAECTVEVESCRYTGGGVDTDGNWDHTLEDGKMCRNGASCANEADVDRYQFGGQGGAPTASDPQPWGEWTHHQQQGPSGSFTFHGGTASAPPGSEIDKIICSDPGYCAQARPAPFKQLDMWGIGTFKNLGKGSSAPAWEGGINANVKAEGGGSNFKGTFHWFEVNVDDLGEPGNKNDGAPDSAACPSDGFGLRSSTPLANCDCPDYYRITIYDGAATADAAKAGALGGSLKVIYQVYGYIDGGNLQIHPAIK